MGKSCYYLTSFEGNANLWETNIRTRETKQLIRLNTRGERSCGIRTWKTCTCFPAAKYIQAESE